VLKIGSSKEASQWWQAPSKVKEDKLSKVRREASRYFRNKEREYLKDGINELESSSKNKNIRDLYRGINEFKKAYQPETNLVNDEKAFYLLILIIVRMGGRITCQLLNVQRAVGVRQTEIHTGGAICARAQFFRG
jgi:hypothetical protein